jgi:ABC-type branched-subunit amino acid transport system substrate-binding protein
VIALLGTVALLGAACSESTDDNSTATTDDDGGAATTEPSARTTRGVSDDSIKVGGMLYSQFFSGADVGAQARFDRANREGGVHGRTIDFVGAEDTNNEQSNALAIAQRLVQQEEVFAILPVASAQVGISDFARQEKVPFFGYGIDTAFCGNEYGFGVTGCVTDPNLERGSNASGLVVKEYFDGDTDKTVALIGEDNDAARGGLKLLTGSLEAVGYEVVSATNPVPAPPAPVGDFSPFVTELLRADDGQPPDVVYIILTGASTLGLNSALKAAGFEGTVVVPSYDPRIAGSLEGNLVIVQFGPFENATDVPAIQQLVDDVQATDADQLLTVGVLAGYWSADMFLALLEETGEDLTVERLLAASDGWSYGVEGAVGESSWPENHDVVVPCSSGVRAEGGAFVSFVGLVCGENIDVEQ